MENNIAMKEANSHCTRLGGSFAILSMTPFFKSFLSNFSFGFLLLQVHVLPQEMLGRSTFGLSMWLLKWFPMRLVDQILLLVSRFTLGDTSQFGLNRPKLGPIQLKNVTGKTPVLDVGTLAKIRSGDIKVIYISGHHLRLLDCLYYGSIQAQIDL